MVKETWEQGVYIQNISLYTVFSVHNIKNTITIIQHKNISTPLESILPPPPH